MLEQDPRYHLGFEPETFLDSRTPWLFAFCNNMSVSRKLLDTVGGFNEDFRRWGYEDNELAYRISSTTAARPATSSTTPTP